MDPDTVPLTFFRKASGSISGPYDDVVRPAHVRLLDYEVEIGLVIGREMPVGTDDHRRTISPTTSPGLVVTNDVSARDVQLPKTQFYEAKSYPTFTPVGPALVLLDADELKRFTDLRLRLWVNGELRQDMTVADMIYPPVAGAAGADPLPAPRPGRPAAHRHPGRHRAERPAEAVAILASLLPPAVKWKLFFARPGREPEVPAGRRRHRGHRRHRRRRDRPRPPAHGREVRPMTDDLLWPALRHARRPRRDRGRAAATRAACPSPPTRCSTRAATLWPDRTALTVLPDARALAGAAAAQLRRAARRCPPLREPAPRARRAARRRGRPDGAQLRRADHRDAGRAARRHRRPPQRRAVARSTSPSCCAAPAPACSSRPGPNSRPRRGRPRGDSPRDGLLDAVLVLRPTGAAGAPGRCRPSTACASATSTSSRPAPDPSDFAGEPPRDRPTWPRCSTPAAPPARRSWPRTPTPTRSPTPGCWPRTPCSTPDAVGVRRAAAVPRQRARGHPARAAVQGPARGVGRPARLPRPRPVRRVLEDRRALPHRRR